MPDTQEVLSADQVAVLFAAIDRGDIDGATSYFHDDIEVCFGNSEPVVGKDGFSSLYRQFMAMLGGIRHELHDVWHAAQNEEILVVPMTVHYTRLDKSVIGLPCCNTFRVDRGLIRAYRVYIDISPVFAAGN